MRRALWIYGRWRKDKSAKTPFMRKESMISVPDQSLTFNRTWASILTFEGRVTVKLLYVEEYHSRYKGQRLKEARLVERRDNASA